MPKSRSDISQIAKHVADKATGDRAPMSAEQFRTYQRELGGLTHAATADLMGLAEVTVKRYATSRPIPENVAIALRAVVLLHRAGRLKRLCEMS